ncbi:hypothetical protein NADE_008000 [Nannochloris sp. 'desiccata']|nr:hypothetical protein KSW81_006140 [Chlorella desiccata (nom. nud.)]KAH7619712.1 hypothetical protein NADE_008000 [Chlorella desiccata (nom. nud.)]
MAPLLLLGTPVTPGKMSQEQQLAHAGRNRVALGKPPNCVSAIVLASMAPAVGATLSPEISCLIGVLLYAVPIIINKIDASKAEAKEQLQEVKDELFKKIDASKAEAKEQLQEAKDELFKKIDASKAEAKEQLQEVKDELFKKIDANSVDIKAVLAAVNEWKTQAGEWRLQDQAAMYTAVSDAETRTNAKINGLTNNIVNASLMAPRVPSAAGSNPPSEGGEESFA